MSDTAYALRDSLIVHNPAIFTGTGNFAMTNSGVLVVRKGTGAATGVTLPVHPSRGRFVFIKDGKGDAATNNITITDPSSNTIDGASSLVISANYGKAVLMWDGSTWNVY